MKVKFDAQRVAELIALIPVREKLSNKVMPFTAGALLAACAGVWSNLPQEDWIVWYGLLLGAVAWKAIEIYELKIRMEMLERELELKTGLVAGEIEEVGQDVKEMVRWVKEEIIGEY